MSVATAPCWQGCRSETLGIRLCFRREALPVAGLRGLPAGFAAPRLDAGQRYSGTAPSCRPRKISTPHLSGLRTDCDDRRQRGDAQDALASIVLADAGDYDEMNRVWREFFPVDPPARTACALQLSNGNGVEIECIALAGESPAQGT